LYFGYESHSSNKQKQNYAIAISETIKILEKSNDNKSYKPIDDYLARTKKRQLTVNFLNNFITMLNQEFNSPFEQLQYVSAQITVSKEYLCEKQKDIIFACPYIEDNENNRIIIITFSTPKNMTGEICVLKGLITEFKVDRPFSKNIKSISYWDLSNGEIIQEDYTELKSVSREDLIKSIKAL
jgi:hypothetical protein